MAQDFRKLDVWNRELELIPRVYTATETFPPREKFALIQQTERATCSILLNITEGAGSDYPKDFVRFLMIAKRSAFETIGCFEIAIKLNYVPGKRVSPLLDEIDQVAKMINGLQESIRKTYE